MSAEAIVALKTNRSTPRPTLRLTAAQAEAYRQEIAYWTGYFRHPVRNGALKADLVTGPAELRQFTAFVTWAAWASVKSLPGAPVVLAKGSGTERAVATSNVKKGAGVAEGCRRCVKSIRFSRRSTRMNLMKLPSTRDIVTHTATADHAFDSRSMAAEGVWTYVARRTCTLPYRCAFHPIMAGQFRVQ